MSHALRLAALLAILPAAAAAQTVRLEPVRMDDNPVFPRSTSMPSARNLTDGLPAGAAMPVRLDSVRHAYVALSGAPDSLLVVVGTDAEGRWQTLAGAAGGERRPAETSTVGVAGRPVSVGVLPSADGAPMALMLMAVADHGLLIFQHLDARVGQADFGGAARAVALVLAPDAGAYAVEPGLVVIVDADGDGVLGGMAAGAAGEPAEAYPADVPFRVGDHAYRLASVTPDGTEATFEAVADDVEALAIGFRMPGLALERLDGMPMRLSDLRGRVVVLNWWADFCRPCYAEMPGLTRLAADYADDPRVAFVAVARNTRDELAAALVGRTFGYEQTTAGEEASATLGDGFPRHVVLDADGRVRFDLLGGSEDIHEMLAPAVAAVVAAMPGE